MKEFEPKPYPSLEGLKNMQRLLAMQNPKLADVNTANLMDITFMRKLEETGFLAQIFTAEFAEGLFNMISPIQFSLRTPRGSTGSPR